MKRKQYRDIMNRIDSKESIVVTGMRRVGKTTLMRQIFHDVKSDNKIFLDLENPVNQKYFEEENYDAIPYAFESLGIRSDQQAFIFLDEIQFARTIPSVVKYLSDHYAYKFFLTGSSSFYLKNLFSESLSGRKIIYELFPLDFKEFLELKKSSLRIPPVGTCHKPLYNTIEPLYREYVEFGGFPGVVTKTSIQEKKEALEEIFTAYFNKEVTQIGGFRHNSIVRNLILLLSVRTGGKIDVQKLSSELGISRITTLDYLSFLEGTYFIRLVPPYSRGLDTEIRGAKKVYLCDSGLARRLGGTDWGHLFETAIYHQLHMRGGTISYYQRKSGVELDFIENGKSGWEVKTHGYATDLKLTRRIVKELSLTEGDIISYDWSSAPVVYGFQM